MHIRKLPLALRQCILCLECPLLQLTPLFVQALKHEAGPAEACFFTAT